MLIKAPPPMSNQKIPTTDRPNHVVSVSELVLCLRVYKQTHGSIYVCIYSIYTSVLEHKHLKGFLPFLVLSLVLLNLLGLGSTVAPPSVNRWNSGWVNPWPLRPPSD